MTILYMIDTLKRDINGNKRIRYHFWRVDKGMEGIKPVYIGRYATNETHNKELVIYAFNRANCHNRNDESLGVNPKDINFVQLEKE